MSVIIRLQGLSWSASAMDIRNFFKGLGIPPGGVHIIGGDNGDAFIAFSTDEDARQAMMMNNKQLNESIVQLFLSSKTEMQNTISKAKEKSVTPTASSQPPVLNQSLNVSYDMTGYGASRAGAGYPNTSSATTQLQGHQLQTHSEPALPGEYSVGGMDIYNQHQNFMQHGQQGAPSEHLNSSYQHGQPSGPLYSQASSNTNSNKVGAVQSSDLQKILASLPQGDPASLQKILQSALQMTKSDQPGSGDSTSAPGSTIVTNVGFSNSDFQQPNKGDGQKLFSRTSVDNVQTEIGQNKVIGLDNFKGNYIQSDGRNQRFDPRDTQGGPPFMHNPNFDQHSLRPFNETEVQNFSKNNFDQKSSTMNFREPYLADSKDPDHRFGDRDTPSHNLFNRNEKMEYNESRDIPYANQRGQAGFGNRHEQSYFNDRNTQSNFGGKDTTPLYVGRDRQPGFENRPSVFPIEHEKLPPSSLNREVPQPYDNTKGPFENLNENMSLPSFGDRQEYGRPPFDARGHMDKKEQHGPFLGYHMGRSIQEPFNDIDHKMSPLEREMKTAPFFDKTPQVSPFDKDPHSFHFERGQQMPLVDRGPQIAPRNMDHRAPQMATGFQIDSIDKNTGEFHLDRGQQKPFIGMGPQIPSSGKDPHAPLMDGGPHTLPKDRDPENSYLERGQQQLYQDKASLVFPAKRDLQGPYFDTFHQRPFMERGPYVPSIDRSRHGQFMNRGPPPILPQDNRLGPPVRSERGGPQNKYVDNHNIPFHGREGSQEPSSFNNTVNFNENSDPKKQIVEKGRTQNQPFGNGNGHKPFPKTKDYTPSSQASVDNVTTPLIISSFVETQNSSKAVDSNARPVVIPNKRDAFGRDLRENEASNQKTDFSKSGGDGRERSRDRSSRRDSPRHDRERRSRDKDRDRDRNRDRDRYRDDERSSRRDRDRDRDRRNRERDESRRDRRRESDRKTSPYLERGSKKRSLSPKDKKESNKHLQKDIPAADNPGSQGQSISTPSINVTSVGSPSINVTSVGSNSKTTMPFVKLPPLGSGKGILGEKPVQHQTSSQLGQDKFLGDAMDLDEPEQASPSDLFEDIIEVEPNKTKIDEDLQRKNADNLNATDVSGNPELQPGLLGDGPKEEIKTTMSEPFREEASQGLLLTPDVPPLLSLNLPDPNNFDNIEETSFTDNFGPREPLSFRGRGFEADKGKSSFGLRGPSPAFGGSRFEMRGARPHYQDQPPWTPDRSFDNRDYNREQYPRDSNMFGYQDENEKFKDRQDFRGPQRGFDNREPPKGEYRVEEHTSKDGFMSSNRGRWPYDGGRNEINYTDNKIRSERRDRSDRGFFSVLIEGLSTDSSYRDIRRFFGEGEIARDGIKLINNSNGKRTDKAYVRFLSDASLKSGLRKHNCLLRGHEVSIKTVPKQEFELAIDLFTPETDNSYGTSESKTLEMCNTITATLETLRESEPSAPSKKDLIIQMTQLPSNSAIPDIQKYFAGCAVADKSDAIVLNINSDGVCCGNAFVEFSDVKSYEKALKYKRSINGKLIKLNPASKKEMYSLIEKLGSNDSVSEQNIAENSDNQTCVQIKNIAPEFSLFDARSLFNGINIAPRGIQVCHDSIGKPVGEVYVEFMDKMEAAKALKKDGTFYKNYRVAVKSVSKHEMITNLRTLRQSLQPAAPSKQEVFYFVKASNLPEKVTTGELMYFFSGYSPAPESMRLNIQDGSSKAGTSTALIGFRNKDHAETAVNEVNQRTLRGMTVTLTKVIL